jgi:uncharacterized protein (TIGR02466 family)
MTSPYRISFTSTPGREPARPAIQPIDLFATRIWQAPLTGLMDRMAAWAEAALAMRTAQPTPAGRSNRLGWNSADQTVLTGEGFAPLDAAVRDHCRVALQDMGVAEPMFELQSWFNIHDRDGFNFLHMHDGVLLSGSVYLRVPKGSGPLVFRDPRSGVINSPIKGAGPNAHKDVRLAPSDGLLVMFPNWLEHYVEPHEGDTPRIAIAFNARAPG